MEESRRRREEEESIATTVDWRPSKPSKHGGMTAAVFVLGVQGLEMMGIAGVGSNLISYALNDMHFSLPKSANTVTNFVGTIFLLSLLGGFLSDSFLGSFYTILLFGFVELSGFILLALQAHVDQLRPPTCINVCEEAKGYKACIFYGALYLLALGSGCLKPNIISLGASQFQSNHHLSTFFNSAYFAFCTGQLLALTLLVWIQTHFGMSIGFAASAAAMAAALILLISGSFLYTTNNYTRGSSIFTPIAQVFIAAFHKRNIVIITQQPTKKKFAFLDKACVKIDEYKNESPWRLCSASQVEQVKILLSLVPIFASTIIFNTILAQLQTFSVQQGRSMNARLAKGGFEIPPASLQAIPYIMLIFVVPLYETLFVPLARKFTRKDSGISPLQRIGTGLFIATFSMVAAAVVERKRRNSSSLLSIFWIAPQFLIFGVSEMFTAVGLIEFFYKQSIQGMQSFLTAMTYCSYSFGFYLSSVLVSLVNRVTSNSTSSGGGWLSDNDLDKDRLDLFYWLLAALSLVNFFNYLFWSTWYPSPSSSGEPGQDLADKQTRPVAA